MDWIQKQIENDIQLSKREIADAESHLAWAKCVLAIKENQLVCLTGARGDEHGAD